MKKSYLYLAAAMALASCANDDYVGGENLASNDTTPIAFNMNTPATTRAGQLSAGEAATALNNEFIVWGEKDVNSTSSTVFENYRVQYKANTANTTTSNTKDWEYVGITPYTDTQVIPSILTANANAKQTIKYWDFGKKYTFTAVSALSDDISGGKVKITKNYEKTTKLEHGYTIVLNNGAKAENIFVADRQEVTNSKPAAGATVDPVKLVFRNFQTKVRFGFYETVPGYNVQITKVTYGSTSSETSNKFGVNGQFVKAPTTDNETVTYEVTYDSKNIPVVTVTPNGTSTTSTTAEFGGNVFNKNLGTESNSNVVYDQDGGTYTCILPNTGNSTDMTFKVSYKLISEDTKEEIVVEDKQVTVPSQYCQWKPNFAYTYLFKVSDKSAELYPITFDAVVAEDEVNKQETITEVGEPSITTIAFNGDNVVTSQNEYAAGNTIYATTNAADGMTASNTKLYTVTATAGTGATPVISEASVANCLTYGKKNDESNPTTWTTTDVTGGTLVVTKSTEGSIVSSVPSELAGGAARSINALTWTGSANTTYVVEYEPTTGTKYYKVVLVK